VNKARKKDCYMQLPLINPKIIKQLYYPTKNAASFFLLIVNEKSMMPMIPWSFLINIHTVEVLVII
jgi:hypothetical protein